MSELVSNGVQIYQFPTDDEAVSEINASMNVSQAATLKKSLCLFTFLYYSMLIYYMTCPQTACCAEDKKIPDGFV